MSGCKGTVARGILSPVSQAQQKWRGKIDTAQDQFKIKFSTRKRKHVV
jgi:hypothetical protein